MVIEGEFVIGTDKGESVQLTAVEYVDEIHPKYHSQNFILHGIGLRTIDSFRMKIGTDGSIPTKKDRVFDATIYEKNDRGVFIKVADLKCCDVVSFDVDPEIAGEKIQIADDYEMFYEYMESGKKLKEAHERLDAGVYRPTCGEPWNL